MINYKIKNLLLSAGCLWLTVTIAQAQSLEILDNAIDQPIIKQTGQSFHMIYKVSARRMEPSLRKSFASQNRSSKANSVFRLLDFDTLLNITDTTMIHLAGTSNVLSYADDGVVSYMLFKTVNGLVLYLYNKLTHEQKYAALGISNRSAFKRSQCGLTTVNNGNGVIFYRQLNKRHNEVIRFGDDGSKVWSKLFVRNDMPFKLSFMINPSRFIVIQTGKPVKRNQLLQVSVFDATSGKELANTDFTKQSETLSLDNYFLPTDTSLWITGRGFTGKKVNPNKTGRPYVINYTDKGIAHEINFDRVPLKMTKFIWETITTDNEGRQYLVGETFHSGSLGGYITKIVLASPLLLLEAMISPNSTNNLIASLVDNTKIHFEDVVYLPLSLDGKDNSTRFLQLTPKTYRSRGFTYSYPLAQIASGMAQNRLVGTNRFGQIFFKDGNSFRELDLNQFKFNKATLAFSGSPLFFSKDYSIQLSHSLLTNSYSLNVIR